MFTISHMDDSSERDASLNSLSGLYDELYLSKILDGEVPVTNQDSGWCISAYRDGRIVFGNLKDPNVEQSDRHMIPVPKERVLELWKRLIAGDIDSLLKEPWKPGYGIQ